MILLWGILLTVVLTYLIGGMISGIKYLVYHGDPYKCGYYPNYFKSEMMETEKNPMSFNDAIKECPKGGSHGIYRIGKRKRWYKPKEDVWGKVLSDKQIKDLFGHVPEDQREFDDWCVIYIYEKGGSDGSQERDGCVSLD
jgi:hypothetical protein